MLVQLQDSLHVLDINCKETTCVTKLANGANQLFIVAVYRVPIIKMACIDKFRIRQCFLAKHSKTSKIYSKITKISFSDSVVWFWACKSPCAILVVKEKGLNFGLKLK